MKRDERFTPQAEKRWKEIDRWTQTRLLNNVWCSSCHNETTIVRFTGRIEQSDLILEGFCIKCDGPVARVIEAF